MLLRRIPLSTTLITLSGFLAFIAIASITFGPMNISFTDSLRGLVGAHSELAPHIQLVINEIRLPRTILCMFIGAILAICGVVMQGLFRNPLAEPGIIGVSAGAALGGAFAIVVFAEFSQNHPQLMNLAALPLFAFLGGALTTVLVYWLGTNKFGTSVTIMLLAGVAISALSGAAIGFLNFSADDQMLRDLTLWSMGSLAGANWAGIGLASVTLVVLLFWFHKKAMSLNALLLGESEARHLGVPVQKLKRQLILLSAVGVGVTVSICGAIGFIGLVIPHLGRMLARP